MKLSLRIVIALTGFFSLTCAAENGTETLKQLRATRARLHTVRDRLELVVTQIRKDAAEGKPFPGEEWAAMAGLRAVLLRMQDGYLAEDEKSLARDRTIPYDRKRLYEISAALDVADVTAAYLAELARIAREKAGGKRAGGKIVDMTEVEKEAARNLPRTYSHYRRSEWTLKRATMEPIDMTEKVRESLELRDILAYEPEVPLDTTSRDGIADVTVVAMRYLRTLTVHAARQAVRKASLDSLQMELNRVRTEIEFGRNTPENEKRLATLMKQIQELGREAASVPEARR